MLLSWIIYFAVMIASGVFFILYKDLLALILFIAVLCVPVILLIIQVISFLLTKIEFHINDTSAGIDKPVNVIIKIKNRSPFAVTHIKMTAKCKNLFLNTEHDCKFIVNSAPFSSKKFTYQINSEHIGNIDFSLKKAIFYDYFSLFRLTKKINLSKIIPIYPAAVNVSSSIRPNDFFIGETDMFSNAKAGDDPSEVFNIREYKDGDKLNKIHWKLTTKNDKYMVKDYSLPVSDNIFIYVDLQIKNENDDSLKLIDSMIKTFISVSEDFIKKDISHYIGWYNSRRNIFNTAKIKEEADIFIALNRIFSDTVFKSEPLMENCEFFIKNKYSHIIFMSTNSANSIEKQFSAFNLQASLISIVSVDYEKDGVPSSAEIEFIPVVPGAEEQCLCDIRF